MALVPWSPLRNGFLSGKYRRDAPVTDSARAPHVGGPDDGQFAVIDVVAAIAAEHATTSGAVALGWLLTRPGTVVPILGARRLDDVSTPTLNYPAATHGEQRAMLQFAGATVDGETSAVYPPLTESSVRY